MLAAVILTSTSRPEPMARSVFLHSGTKSTAR